MTLCIAKNITKITLTTALLLIVVVACNRSSMQPPMYGVKIQYVQGQPLNYPDVTLEFVGKRETPATSDYPRSTIFYDFKVYQGNQAQLISWSAGTGDIGPTLFELDGNRYALELAMSDELGVLDENELVLWQEIAPTSPPPALPTPTSLSPVEIALNQSFSLALNQHGRLDSTGLGVQFYQMVEDTRCPRQVECEIEGWARISVFVWITDIGPVEFILNTSLAANQNVVFYDEYQVQLLNLDPYPETAVSDIAPQDYRATFIATKPDPTPTSNLDPDIEEVAVHNALLASQFPGDNIDQVLIIDHTRVNQTSLLEMDLARFQESASPAAGLVANFKERNQQPYPLEPVLDFGLEYQLLTQEEVDNLRPLDEASGWELFYEKYPNSVGFIYLSRVGFSADFSQALVYMSQYHYDQPIRGGYYLMTRQDGGWVIETGMEWMT